MKKILIALVLCYSAFLYGQSQYSLGYITKNSSSERNASTGLDGRIQSVLGVYKSNINSSTIYLLVNTLGVEYGKIEGIKVKTTAKVIQQWSLIDVVLNRTLESKQFTFSGSGDNDMLAIQNAYSQISLNNKSIRTWLDKKNEAIQNYYTNSCKELVDKAQREYSNGSYINAYTILDALPLNTDCYNSNVALKESYKQTLQKTECEKTVAHIQALRSAGKYEEAINKILNANSGSAQCHIQLMDLSKKISEELKSEYIEYKNLIIKWQSQEFEIQKESAKFSSRILEEYYKNAQVLYLK